MPRRTALAATLLLIACGLGAAEPVITVTQVDIDGAKQTHPDRARFVIGVRAGRSYPASRLTRMMADDVRALERVGPFTDIRVESQAVPNSNGTQVRLAYRFRELARVGAIEYVGLGYFQEDDAIKATELRAGGWLNPRQVEADRRAIENHFRDQGRRDCRVQVETREADGLVRLRFLIDLGTELRVGRVLYENLPAGVRPKHFRDQLFNGDDQPFHQELMDADSSAALRVLQDQGWLDARLIETRVLSADYVPPLDARRRQGPDLVPDGLVADRVVIVYRFEPGERYHLGEVAFVGNQVVGKDELREAFSIRDPLGGWQTLPPGHPYKARDIEAATERARRLISNRGYARCQLRPVRSFDREKRLVNLTLQVVEGTIYRVGRVDFSGNERTRDAVVRRAMSLHPGDLWNDDRRDESKRQIERTGLYNDQPGRRLRIDPEFPPDRPDEVDLRVDLSETSTASVSFQVSYSTVTGVAGEIRFTERNFDLLGLLSEGFSSWRGGAQTLDASIFASTERTSVGASWTNRHVLDGPYSLSFSGSRSESTQRDWDERRLAASAVVGRRFFSNDLHLTMGYTYLDRKIDDIQLDAPDDAVEGDSFANQVSLGQDFDRLNNPMLPTRGFVLGAREEFAGVVLPASAQTFEYTLRGEGYLPLAEAEDGGVTFLRGAGRFRNIRAIGDTDAVPFYDRYVGGGPAPRHRGFEVNELGPKEINGNGYEAKVGGTSDLLLTAEVWLPLQGTNEGMRLVGFLDHGQVWGDDESFSWGTLRTAAGIGIRFPIQLPVSLDFARLLDARDGEASTQIHFGVGQVRF